MKQFSPLIAAATLSSMAFVNNAVADDGAHRSFDEWTGVVFEDLNKNGTRDRGERGIPNVLVSNGTEVVKTGRGGRYKLTVEGDTILFVIKPAGYALPTNENMLPKFYYIHQPNGTPDDIADQIQARAQEFGEEVVFDVIAPTGPLPESVDFPLYKADEDDEFKAIMIADPQPQRLRQYGIADDYGTEVNYVRDDFVAQAIGTKAVLGITHGDIMFDDLSLFHRQNAAIGRLGMPWLNVVGNHDINFVDTGDAASNDKWSNETFKAIFGPADYAYEYGDTMFIVLDNVAYDRPNYRAPNPTGGRYHGELNNNQLSFVRNLLKHVKKNKLVVVSTHIPLLNDRGQSSTVNSDALFSMICDRPNKVALAGHTHTAYHVYAGEELGCTGSEMHNHILATVSGGWWSGPFDERGIPTSEQRDGTPNGYYIMHVDGNEYYNEYVPMEKPEKNQMRIMLESATFPVDRQDVRPGENYAGLIPQDQLGSTTVVVNLFDGGARSKVSFEVVGQDAVVEMTHVLRMDPFVKELYENTPVKSAENPAGRKSWMGARNSTHIWEAALPVSLSKGTHKLVVKAVDEFGKKHVMEKVFEVL